MAPGFWAAALGAALAAAAPAMADEAPKYGGILTYMIPADSPPSFDAQREETSAVAVCCSKASRVSVKRRAFSIAMTACAAKFCSSAICLSVNGRGS